MVNLFSKFKSLFFDKKIKKVEEKTINLPIEVQIDVLKCLNYDQLFSLQQVNYHFNYLIEQNKWIFALKEFDDIHTIENEDYTYVIKPIPDVVYEQIDNKVLVKWQYAIDKRIPLFLFFSSLEYPEGCLVFLSSLNEKYLDLTLPNYRKNIEEMKIVRFWLEQLFRCSFKYCLFGPLFNPEMIKILFHNNKNIHLKFNIHVFDNISFDNSCLKNQMEFICDHLFISKRIFLCFYFMDNIEEQNNILLEILLNLGNNIFGVSAMSVTDFLILYNLIINFIKMSEDCSKMVPYIKFGEFFSLDLKMKIKPDKIEMNGENKVALCEYKNNFNPKIKFLIKYYYEKPNNDIIGKIKIKRIK